MNRRSDVEVLIDGKQYRMGGYESEEYLQKVAAYINAKHAEFRAKDTYRMMDSDLRNILMQINLADDYFKLKKSQEEATLDSEEMGREISELKRERISMQTRLDAAEQENQALRQENLEMQKKMIRLETELEERKKHAGE